MMGSKPFQWKLSLGLGLGIILNFLSCASFSDAYLQEITLHDSVNEDGNVFIFRRHVPDTSKFDLSGVQRVCGRGGWIFYDGLNYTSRSPPSGGSSLFCRNIPFTHKSFRYVGANDTDQDGMSLFSGANFEGPEILVTDASLQNISIPIKSCGFTGPTPWTFFEGPNFDGKSACVFKINDPVGFHYQDNILLAYGLSTVGSLFKGCPTVRNS